LISSKNKKKTEIGNKERQLPLRMTPISLAGEKGGNSAVAVPWPEPPPDKDAPSADGTVACGVPVWGSS
jgi:hypothetical protein